MKRKNGKHRVIVALREYRAQHGLTQKAMADKLGLKEVTYRSYENGNRTVPAESAVDWEKRIGLPRERVRSDLFKRDEQAA